MIRKSLGILLTCGILFLLSGDALAQDTPIGMWRTIDDNTGEARSHVEILEEADGTLSGYIRHLTDETRRDALCEVCPEDHGKDQPVVGLQIIWGVTAHRSGDWRGGNIMDPESGKIYRVRITPVEDGQKLEVRGFVGISLLGRTQTWERIQ